jgi:hypothetical protein
MANVVKGMDRAMQSMNLEKVKTPVKRLGTFSCLFNTLRLLDLNGDG